MGLDYAHLFEMTDPGATRPFRLTAEEDERFQAGGFDAWIAERLQGKAHADPPLRLVARSGGQAADVMWFYPGMFVISARLASLFTTRGLTGWGTYAVEVIDRRGGVLPGYGGLAVTGQAGRQDLRRVEVITKAAWVGGNPGEYLKGVYFENDYWDGSDFCLVGTTSTKAVTGKVVHAFNTARIRNVKFTRLVDVATPSSTYTVQGLWPLKPLDPR